MDWLWRERVLQLKYRTMSEQDEEFEELVNQAYGNVDYDTAIVLLQTYIEEPDYGIQESVTAVLLTAPPELYIKVLLDDLPRLSLEAPSWADTLFANKVYHNNALFISLARSSDPIVKQELMKLLQRDLFKDLWPETKLVIDALSDSEE